MLLAASLLPDLNVDLNQEPNKTSWEQAIAIFERYTSYDISAQSGIQALLDYRQQFEAFRRGGEPPQNEPNWPKAQPSSQSSADGTISTESLSNIDNVLFGADVEGPVGDLPQAFMDWNWLDFDITDFAIS